MTRGQVIGLSGEKGSPGAPHLHFEVSKYFQGKYVPVDPYGWVGQGCDPYQLINNIVNDRLWVFQNPITDIKANGSDTPVTITTTDALSVTIGLTTGDLVGKDADWWALADTPFGWYRYNVGTHSWQPGQAVTYQGPIRDLPTREILNMTGLPAGTYTFSFEVDTTMNGIKDMPIYSDSVGVTVTP